jgi:hypothetical protein
MPPQPWACAQLALGEDELPQCASHLTLCRLDVTADLVAAPDPFDRDPRNLREGFVAQLDRSCEGRDDALIVRLADGHC